MASGSCFSNSFMRLKRRKSSQSQGMPNPKAESRGRKVREMPLMTPMVGSMNSPVMQNMRNCSSRMGSSACRKNMGRFSKRARSLPR